MSLRLGLNIDHVATLRNARGGNFPDPLRAARLAESTGVVDGITAHLREDRRHIRDADIDALVNEIKLPLNLEMAATAEMQAIALRYRPHAVCIVPEKREERTTEGGLDVVSAQGFLSDYIAPLREAGSRVSLFIAAEREQVMASSAVGAAVVEIHTGAYCEAFAEGDEVAMGAELRRIIEAAELADEMGLEVHAGHGLTYSDVAPIAAISVIKELNIGHFLISESVFIGLEEALTRMRAIMDEAR